MADSFSEDRLARITLAAASEPGDTVDRRLIARVGAVETLELMSSDGPLPGAIDPAEAGLWRRRLAPRLDPGHGDRIREDMKRRGLTVLTVEDLNWPAELQQLGTIHRRALAERPTEQARGRDRRPDRTRRSARRHQLRRAHHHRTRG